MGFNSAFKGLKSSGSWLNSLETVLARELTLSWKKGCFQCNGLHQAVYN